MTVLEVAASSRFGGVETYLMRLTQHLRAHDHRVIFATRRGVPLARGARALGFPVIESFRGGKNLRSVWNLARLMRRERVDVVHTHLFSANSQGALAARLVGIPSVARVPATENAAHYRRSTYVTAVSHNVARHLEAQCILKQKVRVFYNGIPWQHFDSVPPQNQARRKLGLPTDAFVIVCVANLTSRKGHRFLLEALAQLPDDAYLLLCGEGPEENMLHDLATRLNIQQRTSFAGFLTDIRPALAAGNAFVLPSLQEGLPNAVLEALAAHLPTVATSIAGTPEVIEHGNSGLLVPPGTVEPLATALLRLRDDTGLRCQLAANGRYVVETRFDGTDCMNQVEEFLKSVVGAWQNGRELVEF